MNEQDKQAYLEKYKKDKEKGVPFFPDILFKDAVISLVIFALLFALAYFMGAPLEERANPSDTNYTPRPEWYFLFLFQLLKYFPGELEVIGVFIIPTLVVVLLLALPFIDRGRMRHFTNRKPVVIVTALGVVAIIALTVLSIIEAPPPAEQATGDQVALLYTTNCAGCHGPASNVPPATNLHEVIAEGTHAGMPPWSGDLTSDQIDALVGFILSPAGSALFNDNCAECHEVEQLIASDPLQLKGALEEGVDFEAHADAEIQHWPDVLGAGERTALLNFLVAPDGQRLFATNCAACHGSALAYEGSAEELRHTIEAGGLHLEMPAWQGRLSGEQIEILASYVQEPTAVPEGEDLYQQNCVACHFERVPRSESVERAYEYIATGGSHETMPVWGEILTSEQIDALVAYTLEAGQGTGAEAGRQIYVEYCASCHGDFGEGGPNPSRPGDVIAPISTAEYLATRDDLTLRAIITQGQPNFGMSPFGLSEGGPLDNEQIDALVFYMRSWQADPPVELPPDVQFDTLALSGAEIYQSICAQCHGLNADGLVGPSLRTSALKKSGREAVFTSISEGHEATSMIAWGEVLSSEQIYDLVDFILGLPESTGGGSGGVSFSVTILPVFDQYCLVCHSSENPFGGWIGNNYDDVINSGDNAPAIVPGDPDNSLLVQKLLGTQTTGNMMPPTRQLPEETIQLILDWIAAGAPDN